MDDIQMGDDSASTSGSARNSSGVDAPSPQTSNPPSEDEFSLLDSPCTPSKSSTHPVSLKQCSPFRSPSSIRAMQLDTTPPHLSSPTRRDINGHPRRLSTPRSARSRRGTPRTMISSPTKTLRKENPLVLLHMTLLPIPHQYPSSVLDHVLPPTIRANWEMLIEKTSPTVLHRGVLVPHPREDYELLEERLLESLELKQPRVLKCGHFHLSEEEEADINVYEDSGSENEDDDSDTCEDCGRKIRNGQSGDAGSGSKRWDVKVFAANGLMRAGAWQAAWREMERVDIEILPWMEESMRRELDARTEYEEHIRQEEDLARKEEGVGGLDDERLREIYGQDAYSSMGSCQNSRRPSRVTSAYRSPSFQEGSRKEFAFLDLIRNYCILLAQDQRNIALFFLSIIVVFLSLRILTPATEVAAPMDPILTPSPVSMSSQVAEVVQVTTSDRISASSAPAESNLVNSEANAASTFHVLSSTIFENADDMPRAEASHSASSSSDLAEDPEEVSQAEVLEAPQDLEDLLPLESE